MNVFGGSFLSAADTAIFTPEQFSHEDRLMGETAERFMRERVLPSSPLLERQEPGLLRALLKEAAQLGLLGIDLPAEYGGLGLSKMVSALLAEKIALEPSFSVSQGVHTSVGCFPLLFFGTPEQKTQWLPELAAGNKIGAYALTEPEAGSDALAARSRAELKGEHYYLHGSKMWISNAGFADLFIVFAKVNGDKFTAFLVPRETPGLIIEREEHKLGLKGSSTCRITLDKARVPTQLRLGEEGQGARVALSTLNLGRFKIAAAAMGLAKETWLLAYAYANERQQFGQPIIQFDLIRHKLTWNRARITACESAAYRLAGDLETLFRQASNTGDLGDYQRAAAEMAAECALLKVASTEALHQMVDDALQIYGGYGFSEEFPIARLYRDTRVNRIYEGTNEINRLNLIDRLLFAIRKETLPLKSSLESFTFETPDLGVQTLRGASSAALTRLSSEVAFPQAIAEPLADMMIELYLLDSLNYRAKQTNHPSLQAATRILLENTRRRAVGWQTDLCELLPSVPSAGQTSASLSSLYQDYWQSFTSPAF